ncbi:hypothetical protein Tco_0838975 [Tanacetum coccineum]|uniref:Uncharacterized protein n=1 Tax=Tanacetum coccineum TaxID=301880 RepID=A0ABQ5ATC7_9ASTR
MPPRMRTRSAGRPVAESLGGGTGVRVGRGGRGRRPKEGNDKCVDDLNGQGNDQGMGDNRGAEGVNRNVEGVNGGRTRLLDDHCPTIAERLTRHASSALLHRSMGWCKATEPIRAIQKAVQIFGALIDEAVKNGSIKKEGRIQVLGPSVPPATPTMHLEGLVALALTVTTWVIWQGIVEAYRGM